MKKIVFCGGGSGGHVTPNIAVINELIGRAELHYIGTDSIEKTLISAIPEVTFHQIKAAKLRRGLYPSNLALPFQLIESVNQCKKILKNIGADLVFSKGGYAALPVVIAAHSQKITCIGHESDYTVGLSHKIAKPYYKILLTTFPDTAKIFGKKGKCVGSPIRQAIYSGDKTKGAELMGFDSITDSLRQTNQSEKKNITKRQKISNSETKTLGKTNYLKNKNDSTSPQGGKLNNFFANSSPKADASQTQITIPSPKADAIQAQTTNLSPKADALQNQIAKPSSQINFNESQAVNRRKVLLVTGGSLGAKQLNDLVEEYDRRNLPCFLDNFDIFVLSGKGKKLKITKNNLRQAEYCNEMHHLYANTDYCITRGGSNTLCELTALNIPFLALPLLNDTRGEQTHNINYFAHVGAGKMLVGGTLDEINLELANLVEKSQNQVKLTAPSTPCCIDGTKEIVKILLQNCRN